MTQTILILWKIVSDSEKPTWISSVDHFHSSFSQIVILEEFLDTCLQKRLQKHFRNGRIKILDETSWTTFNKSCMACFTGSQSYPGVNVFIGGKAEIGMIIYIYLITILNLFHKGFINITGMQPLILSRYSSSTPPPAILIAPSASATSTAPSTPPPLSPVTPPPPTPSTSPLAALGALPLASAHTGAPSTSTVTIDHNRSRRRSRTRDHSVEYLTTGRLEPCRVQRTSVFKGVTLEELEDCSKSHEVSQFEYSWICSVTYRFESPAVIVKNYYGLNSCKKMRTATVLSTWGFTTKTQNSMS